MVHWCKPLLLKCDVQHTFKMRTMLTEKKVEYVRKKGWEKMGEEINLMYFFSAKKKTQQMSLSGEGHHVRVPAVPGH